MPKETKDMRNPANWPEWYPRFEAVIKDYQAKTGASDAAVARKAGLSKTWVSNWLNERKMPGVDTFLAVCDAVDANPLRVLKGGEWSEYHAVLTAEFENAPPDKRRRLTDLIRRLSDLE